MHDKKAVSAEHEVIVFVPTRRARERPTEARDDTPPAPRHAPPSPAYEAVPAGAEHVAVAVAAAVAVGPAAHVVVAVAAAVAAVPAAECVAQNEPRYARHEHDLLQAELRESRSYAVLEHSAALEHSQSVVCMRGELEAQRAQVKARVTLASKAAADKARSEAERLHDLLMRIAATDAQDMHERAIMQLTAELSQAATNSASTHTVCACLERPAKPLRIEYLEGDFSEASLANMLQENGMSMYPAHACPE